MIYLDTHAVVALYSGETKKLSDRGRRLLDEKQILISPMVILELEFLREIKRIEVQALDIVNALVEEISLKICPLPFPKIISQSLTENWTRDPFDRLIVAHARAGKGPLLTKDGQMQDNYPQAFW